MIPAKPPKLNRENLPKNKAILFASLIFKSSSHYKAYYESHIVALPVIYFATYLPMLEYFSLFL